MPGRQGDRGSRRWWMLAVLLAGQVMANVDNAIVNIAVPSVAAGFAAPQGQVALIAAGYLVAFAVLLATGARLGSIHGQRRVFLVGLLGFTAASLAGGLAQGLGWLVLARVVQGASAALLVPQVLSGIQLHFAGPDRVRALGYYTVALSGGAVAGQVLGGVLVSADLFGTGWRPIFLINVPLGVGLLLAGRRLLPETPRRPGGLDWPGVAALSGAVLLLVLPLVLGPDRHWPAWAFVCLVASAPALLGFAVLQRRVAARGGRPLVAPALWRDRRVRLGLLAHGLTTLTYFGLLFVVAVYLQQGLGRSPAYAGLAMVAWVAAFGLAGPLVPRLPARYLAAAPGVGCLILAGCYASVAGYLFAGGLAGAPLFVLLGVGGLGLGISSNSLIGAMTSALPAGYAPDLSGVISTNAQLNAALGVSVASTGYVAAGAALTPAGAFGVVLMGFTVLVLLASGAAAGTRTPRSAPEPVSPTVR